MLLGAGLEHSWHHARAHRFFSAARIWAIFKSAKHEFNGNLQSM